MGHFEKNNMHEVKSIHPLHQRKPASPYVFYTPRKNEEPSYGHTQLPFLVWFILTQKP
jgi:hypothetical protein